MSTAMELDPARLSDSNLFVLAPPGCGKTELLARRAEYLIAGLLPHQRILALTFSNRAKSNLSERLRTTLGAERFRRYIKVTNFHGHAAELTKAHGHLIGVDPASPMPTRSTLDKAIAAYTDSLRIADASELKASIEKALGDAKQGPRNDDEVAKFLAELGNEAALNIELDRRERGLLHYDDLLRHAHRLLSVGEVADLYQQHFGAVLVDEFQDLSLQQLEIALRSAKRSRTFVGDPLQGIYSWAGARPAEVEARLRTICGEPHILSTSYRSSPAVLAVVNGVSELLGGFELKSADPTSWPGGGVAVAASFATGRQEAEWIKERAGQILSSDPAATIGVIARAGWRRRPVDEAFAEATSLQTQRWDLALEDSAVLQHLLIAARRLPRRANMDLMSRTVLAGIDPTDVETIEQVKEALAEFAALAERAGGPAAAVAQLRVPDDTKSIGPGIHLLNAHTGKGQQFDWVFVPGIEEFHIPSGLASTDGQIEEELRVLLVILSRAREGVFATCAKSLISKRGNPYKTKESRWWNVLAERCSALDD